MLIDQVYGALRGDIIGGKYALNQFIVEKDICDEFGISKSTAGEVLRQLTGEGLLVGYPRKGYMINMVSAADYSQILRLRACVEAMVVRTVIRECGDQEIALVFPDEASVEALDNYDFHTLLASLLADKYVTDLLNKLLGLVITTYKASPFAMRDGEPGNCHVELIGAIRRRDTAEAISLLYRDLQYSDPET